MSFKDSYSAVFMVYRVFALAPFQFHFEAITYAQNVPSNDKRQKWNCKAELLYFVCMIAWELCMLVFTSISCYKHSLSFNQNFFNASHMVVVFTFRAFVVVTTVESYLKQNVQVKIMANLYEIDRVFAEKLNYSVNYHRLKRQIVIAFLKWMSILFTAISTYVIITLLWISTHSDFMDWLCGLYPLIGAALIGSKYITHVILINSRIEAMHEILDSNLLIKRTNSIEICTDEEGNRDDEEFEFQRMIYLRWIYSKLYDTVQMTNDSFEWMISMGFSVALIDCSLMMFHAYDDTLEPPNRFTVLRSYSWLVFFVHHVFFMGFIIKMANGVVAEAEKLAHKVHCIGSNAIVLDDLQDFVS